MKFFKKMKDGGAESTVTGYWLVEIKSWFSIVLLKFEGKSREAYHTHAFNCWNWLISGGLKENKIDGTQRFYESSKSSRFFKISREDFHKVDSITPASWVLSFRGPWSDHWQEFLPQEGRFRILTHGRQEV